MGNRVTYGAARGADIVSIKLTPPSDCTTDALRSVEIGVFNWLTTNAPKGSIINWSRGYRVDQDAPNLPPCSSIIHTDLEAAIKAAHDAGLIIVVAAHNDGCNTADYTPTRIAEAFVVGGTSKDRFEYGEDERFYNTTCPGCNPPRISRTGVNISAFAPAENVLLMNHNGEEKTGNGTSMATGYMSGLIATACQAAGICGTTPVASLYEAMRNMDENTFTVTNVGGATLPNGTVPRFIPKVW